MRSVLRLILLLSIAATARAETVVDVSKEWNAHISSSSPAGLIAVPIKPAGEETLSESTTTLACQCDALTPQERLEQSTYAFTGRVADVLSPKKGKRSVVFDVDEIFKGSPKAEMKVTEELSGTDCDIRFEVGQSYLVFAQWEWGMVKTSRCMGTKYLPKAKTDALGPSESLKEKLYIRLRNACMGRYDTPCCLSSLKAMRAGYFIPKPDEGCPDGTVPDRLRCAGSYTWCIPVTDKGHH